MTELTDVKGIGPARAEEFTEAGYDTVESIAETTSAQLAEDTSISEGKASNIITSAQEESGGTEDIVTTDDIVEGAFEEKPDSEEEEPDDFEEEKADDSEEEEPDDSEEEEPEEKEAEPDDSEEEEETQESNTILVELDATPLQEDLLVATLVNHYTTQKRRNASREEACLTILEKRRETSELKFELTSLQLNTLYAAIKEKRNFYQGKNLIDYMNELRVLEDQVQEYRNEFVF